ncbi:MAG: ABC transporter permease, partial [Candidatus Aminicenantes bacterium]|nr:ABC transporter permease [Candidatus Aminicenantes bacterium]
ENDQRTFKLENLGRMHLFSIFGDRRIATVRIFLGVGVLILLMACINFMNLATARSAKRAREVGLRKVVGAGRGQIMAQFLGESFVYVSIALLLSLLLSAALLPVLRNITGQPLAWSGIFRGTTPALLMGVWLLVGFISGSYPAVYLSAFRPAGIFRDSVASGRKGAGFRRILVVFQFTISVILIVSTFTIINQIHYMAGKSLGFRKNQILVMRNPARKSVQPFKESLREYPEIVDATGSVMLPHSIGRYNTVTWEGAAGDESVTIIHNTVDFDFLKTFEIPLVKGRDFSREISSDIQAGSRRPDDAGAVIINEIAAKRFGWEDPIGKKMIQTFGEQRIHYTVIGVMRDFHFDSLRNPVVPLNLFLHPDAASRYISIKIRPGNIPHTLDVIRAAWAQFNPGYPFEYFFYDSVFDRRFQEERSLLTLFQYFSFLAVFIACLGLLGLAAFAAEQRTKEIGIRKILGATSRGIMMLLTGQFSRWVLLANLVAWPLAFVGIRRWLDGYAYHVAVNAWAFVGSGLLVLAVALLTVGFQAFKAARANPADSLRYE